MAMNVANTYKNLRPFIRIDGNGTIIPGSLQFRRDIPKQGLWKELGFINTCCNSIGDSYIIFQLLSPLNADSDLTNISFPGFSWVGSLQDTPFVIVPIPNGLAQNITLIVSSTSTAMDINTSTVSGDGVIAGDAVTSIGPNPQTFVLTTTATPNTQYLVQLTDD